MPGRTILLSFEQGLGDTIQMARYVPLVEQRCGRVVVECQEALRRAWGASSLPTGRATGR